MGSSIIPDEKTVKGIKNVLIIICITLTILIGLIIIVILAKKVGRVADENTFENIMTERGYIVTDETTRFSNASYIITSAILAKHPEGSYNIRFVRLYNQDYSSQFFNTLKTSYEKQKTKSNVVSESFSDDNSKGKYLLTTKNMYVRIEKSGNAVFEASGYPQYKKEVDDLFKELGF